MTHFGAVTLCVLNERVVDALSKHQHQYSEMNISGMAANWSTIKFGRSGDELFPIELILYITTSRCSILNSVRLLAKEY